MSSYFWCDHCDEMTPITQLSKPDIENYPEMEDLARESICLDCIINMEDEIQSERRADADDGQPDEAQEWHDFDPDC